MRLVELRQEIEAAEAHVAALRRERALVVVHEVERRHRKLKGLAVEMGVTPTQAGRIYAEGKQLA